MARTVAEWIGKTPDSKVPDRVRLRIFKAYDGCCYLSGRPIRPGEAWELEHKVALILGGEHRESNLAPALSALAEPAGEAEPVITEAARVAFYEATEVTSVGSIRFLDDGLKAAFAALTTPPDARAIRGVATHRHKKRGTEYVLIGIGKMQAEHWRDPNLDAEYDCQAVDMREVAIYRGVDDGSLWVRPREEFEDGRFEALAGAKS